MIFDTHCHYDDEKYDNDRDELIRTMEKEGVRHFVNVSADKASIDRTLEILAKYPQGYGALGIHPSEITGLTEADMENIQEVLNQAYPFHGCKK